MAIGPSFEALRDRGGSRGMVAAGMAVLLACMVFFGVDVVADVALHGFSLAPYSSAELVHLGFEMLAVGGLGYAVVALRAHHRLLRSEAASSRETIQLLRGHFDQVLGRKFPQWGLTAAERDVTLLIIRGLSIADIAAARSTAQGTIKAQSTSIFRKVGVASKAELMSVIVDEFIDSTREDARPPSPGA